MILVRSKKSWREKIDGEVEWKVVPPDGKRKQSMLVPNPRMIEELVREIPSGAVSTPRLMRKILAARYGAETTCPLCTGIFLRLIAEAANEAREAGHSDVLPYWRVVDSKGKPNPKFPGGVEGQMMLQESELVDCLGDH